MCKRASIRLVPPPFAAGQTPKAADVVVVPLLIPFLLIGFPPNQRNLGTAARFFRRPEPVGGVSMPPVYRGRRTAPPSVQQIRSACGVRSVQGSRPKASPTTTQLGLLVTTAKECDIKRLMPERSPCIPSNEEIVGL